MHDIKRKRQPQLLFALMKVLIHMINAGGRVEEMA